jgi:hypothetical protein
MTGAARARLAVAYAACEVADLARAAVPVGPDELHPDGTPRRPGAVLAEAGGVLAAAHRLVAVAVVFESTAGAGRPPVDDLLATEAHTGAGRWRSHLLRDPAEAARDLDDWVRRHHDGGDHPGPAPVSGGLP